MIATSKTKRIRDTNEIYVTMFTSIKTSNKSESRDNRLLHIRLY